MALDPIWNSLALWDEHCEPCDRLSEEKEAFSKIFGEEFAQAYRRYRGR